MAGEDGMKSDGPTAYTITQGLCFLKPSENPTSTKIIKAKRPVGSVLHSTGNTWQGPAGGLWAEVDGAKSAGEMGWALVEGPGFGIKGPLLVDQGDNQAQIINIRWMKDPPIFTIMMRKNDTIGRVVDALCTSTGLNKKETILTKGLPRKAPNGSGTLLPMDYTMPKDVLTNDMTIEQAKIVDTLNLVYVGHFDEDYHAK
uniref:Uncharacterized protein n=1 Tax=Alexandrium catenella TaxID=2925 RepID=A0A7S1L571_ALECA|mmetsp:Transcript_106663/g.283710  ORF Transcript_106663/g.283710 Transcript_106663/m.283710 type:complete len:200 (+) Transcript_106663:80-679(+)|eukprot:CAMPEP_0171176242 /NCGR_PEP_ID=MMETSP0790-20130122/11635_1 /TAXON_ID=2925 /ORGANISM="Alexandrium catenella, Strain OF101" /LENGTH=199 /DNA_ID=CAMNT_0011641127 /DNA_START=75 /DNA_END=674 /DNA_ORIENTATION=-